MATWLVVLLFSVGAVALFAVGLSLTLIFKGHYIDGEISSNRHMRERGITCAVHDATASLHAEGGASACSDALCSDPNCAACSSTPVRAQNSPRAAQGS